MSYQYFDSRNSTEPYGSELGSVDGASDFVAANLYRNSPSPVVPRLDDTAVYPHPANLEEIGAKQNESQATSAYAFPKLRFHQPPVAPGVDVFDAANSEIPPLKEIDAKSLDRSMLLEFNPRSNVNVEARIDEHIQVPGSGSSGSIARSAADLSYATTSPTAINNSMINSASIHSKRMGPKALANSDISFSRITSRTVYLGNLSPKTSIKDILDHVRGGLIEEIKVLPDRSCAFVSFVEETSALLFHSDAILKRLRINGNDIKIGWGKPTHLEPMVAFKISNDGATRNLYIGPSSSTPHDNETSSSFDAVNKLTESRLRKDLKQYGEIDCIDIVEEKGLGFVHFASIASAIQAVNTLSERNPRYAHKKIFFGKDRCAFVTRSQQYNASQFLGVEREAIESIIQYHDRDIIAEALLQQSTAAAAIAASAGGPNNLGNRTVYLGNLPSNTKIEDICNTVRGGLIDTIKLLEPKHVCFITFVDPSAAAQFYAMSSLYGFIIQKQRCKIGWGKHSGPLDMNIAQAVDEGASRNLYIGNINFDKDSQLAEPFFTQGNLRKIFSQYGDLEQINFLPERKCCFVNFTSISTAIESIDKIRASENFKNLKVNFGKDRCANIPYHQ